MYKLGLVSVSFRNHTPEEILQAMQKTPLKYIEWGSDVHAPMGDSEALHRLVQLQKAYGITCSSYGTYFHLGKEPLEELEGYIDAAQILETDILRLWCGEKDSQDYTDEEKEELFALCRKAASIAERRGVTLCMETHHKTFTGSKESAFELMRAVGSEHFRMYWQPSQRRTEEENAEHAAMIADDTVILHVFNWRGKDRLPLEAGVQTWKRYLSKFDRDRTLLLEFMPDGLITTLETETKALMKIVEDQ